MKTEIKERWVDALRSGDYIQGTDFLARQVDGVTSFCCLGVLCDLAAKEGVVEKEENYYDGGVLAFRGVGDTFSATALLPRSVAEWAGVGGQHTMVIKVNDKDETLNGLNDTDHTFAMIADLIEEQL